MRARQVFLQTLIDHGVRGIFGNPGTTENPLLIGLADYPQLTYYVALHEGVAVCAAGAFAQATDTVAVANVHVAPGLGNAIGMMYGLMRSNSAVVVTAGQQDTRLRLREPLLGHDLVALAAPVSKWAAEVRHPDEMAHIMQQAIEVATSHPRGPVFVALPNNVMESETRVGSTGNAPRAAACVGEIKALAKRLASAAAPLVIPGDDVAIYGANSELQGLVEATGAAVRTDFLAGRLAFSLRHPNWLGPLGASTKAINSALAEHDVVLLVGHPRLEEVWYDSVERIPPNVEVLQIEQSENTLARFAGTTHTVVGALRHTLDALLKALPQTVPDAAAARNEAFAVRQTERDQHFVRSARDMAGRTPMMPLVAMHALGDALPNDVIIVDESITANPFVPLAFNLEGPADFYAGRGGGIGQGVAGALGIAAAQTRRLTVALSGDGSAMYSIQSLWTAAHHRLNLLFVIFANREYRILKHNVDEHRARFADPSDHPYPHMDLVRPNLDFVAMATGMGVAASQAQGVAEIEAAIELACNTEGPYLLEIVVAGKDE